MVPQVDVKDTEVLLTGIRETAEAVRKEILGWVLPKEQTSNDAEAQALRKLAARSAQQTRQWTGRMLGELGTAYPYPNSSDGSTQIIDKTAVPEKNGLELPADATVVQKIKHTRGVLSGLKGQLEVLVTQCIPGTPFNQYLFKVQEHALQTSMWLGELLHEFYEAQPKPEATAGREFTPEEAAADLAKIQADSEPADQFKTSLEAAAAIAKAESYDAGPQYSPEALADIAAVESVGTRVLVNNFAEGKSLPGTIIMDQDDEKRVCHFVQLDEPTESGVSMIALRPSVADAIRDYQIASEAPVSGNESAPTPATEPMSTDSGLGAESSPAAASEKIADSTSSTSKATDQPAPDSAPTAGEDSTKSTEPLTNTPRQTESALSPNGNRIVTQEQKPKTSGKSVRK